jgi:thiamine-phosphate pyrophosphorylase
MPISQAMRIIDANLNRTAEGLRTLEDIARYILDDSGLTQQLKDLRHNLVRADVAFNQQLLQSRDALGDVGSDLSVPGEKPEKALTLIAVANARRVQESLRVLEELTRLPEMAALLDSTKFKQARFSLYTIEQSLLARLLRKDKLNYIRGLYVVIDSQALQGRSHLEAARQVISAGVKVIQLRDKLAPKRAVLEIARALQKLCTEQAALFILNDYLDLALAVNADGLHHGQDDLPFDEARRLLPPDKILGCSIASPEEAAAAERTGADYIAVSGIFPTASKELAGTVGLEGLEKVCRGARAPVVAIGGINLENIGEVVAAGANCVSVISAVLGAPDMAQAARALIQKIEGQK